LFVSSLLPYGAGTPWRPALDALAAWIQAQPPGQLVRLNPRKVASTLSLDGPTVTDAFLAAAQEGWFDLRWDYRCPHCHGVAGFSAHLKSARTQMVCPACTSSFSNGLDTNVEVTFTATPKLSGVDTGEAEALDAPGEPDPLALTGLDVFHRPLFQQRFGDQVLSAEESLQVRHVVLLFTDIRGSTALYERLGDAQAYNLVREHFKVLFQAIEAQGGVVVKTIGDAVMASFRRPAAALEAALTVQGAIGELKVPGTDEAVVVKMGLHAGPALAVTLNGRFDYFGQSVNRAARIQGLARDQEIDFSEAVFQDPSCRRMLAGRKAAVRRFRATLKGIEGEQVIYSVK
jgi:class 3 adenylate cyclase